MQSSLKLEPLGWAGRERRCSSGARPFVKTLAAGLLVGLAASACGGERLWTIHRIQGATDASPLAGERVSLAPVVVSAAGERGFFVAMLPGREDADPATSEGLYVFTGHAPGVQAGQVLRLRGTVVEFHGHTQLVSASWRIEGQADAPAPVRLADAPSHGWESLESMRIHVSSGIVAGPTDRHGDALAAAAGDRLTNAHGSGKGKIGLFELDPNGLGETDRLLTGGTRFRATGPLVFRHGDYVLWPESLDITESPPLPRPVRKAERGELAVATFNLRLFRDDRSDDGEPALDPEVYRTRLAKIAGWLEDVLHCPAVVAVQEVEHRDVLRQIADSSACGYRAIGTQGRPGPELGYLTAEATVAIDGWRELGTARRLAEDGTPLFDRPPLLLWIREPRSLAIVNVHLRSMIGIETEPRVNRKRLAQAEALRGEIENLMQDAAARLIVLGDFNALPFSDGRVDVLARITGSRPVRDAFPPPEQRPPLLHNLVLRLAPAERYSMIYRGRSQLLDHVLISGALREQVAGLAAARGNADAPVLLEHDADTLLRASDHDPLVVYLRH